MIQDVFYFSKFTNSVICFFYCQFLLLIFFLGSFFSLPPFVLGGLFLFPHFIPGTHLSKCFLLDHVFVCSSDMPKFVQAIMPNFNFVNGAITD